jgi:hypothetical protein
MILITCTIASFVAQKGAYNLALQEENEENDNDTDDSIEKILIPIKSASLTDELVNLGVTVKSKKNKSGLYALNVINNKDASSGSENKAKKILDRAEVVAAATDNKLNPLLRYDLNVLNGISSIVKEHKITDLILGLNERDNPEISFFGALTEGILNKCNTTTLLYRSVQPIATVKRYIVVIPDKAEREIGFPVLLLKLWNLGKNTGSKLIVYASETTLQLLNDIQTKHPIDVEFNEFSDWDDFLILSRNVVKDDCFAVVMSRKSHLSYHSNMANVPNYISKYFSNNNVLLLYPMQSGIGEGSKIDLKNPAALDTFTENLERLDDVRKIIGKLFKKK